MKTPLWFIGHGSPMNALADNSFTRSLAGMRASCPNPRAILCISAHWMTEGTWVTQMPKPKTIHDFYGFPPELFAIQYPAPGSVEVAARIRENVKDPSIQGDEEIWGLDHGTWSVLRHIFPEAEIPVLQLSLNIAQPASYHFALGQKLRGLRDEGILIVGSGNVVHNLRKLNWESDATPFPWAVEFDEWVKGKIQSREYASLLEDFLPGSSGAWSVPTVEHYLPLLYVLGAAEEADNLEWIFEGIQNASISMRTFLLSQTGLVAW